jgi:membrane fusion protein, multidrug efflux system
MFLRFILMLVVVSLVFGGIFYKKQKGWAEMAAMAEMEQPPTVIAAAEVKMESWQPALHSVGSMVAVNDVFVTSEVAGIVETIQFESGDAVEKGQTLLQLDDVVDRAELQSLRVDLALAQIQFERAEKLLAERTISQAEYDQNRARLESARANINSKQALIDKKKIRAPFSGQLGIRQVDLGEYLAPGAHIVSLQSMDPIYTDYTLPERYLSDLSVGQTIEIKIQSYPGERFEGRIQAINPGIDPGTRSIRLRAELANPDGRLRPGMFAEVRTLLPQRDDILTLPQQAITYAPYGDTVFVIEEKNGQLVVQRKPVTTGEVRNGRVEILSGLEAGDRVASAGQTKLRNDMAVEIDNSIELDDEVNGP